MLNKINYLFEPNYNFISNQEYNTIDQCFPAFFGLRHPYKVKLEFGGTLRWLDGSKEQGIVKIGGTPGISSWHPG